MAETSPPDPAPDPEALAAAERPAPVPSPEEYRAAARFWHDTCIELRAELDRLREQNAALNAELTAECDSWDALQVVRAELDRTRAVVDAARAMVEGWIERRIKPSVERDDRWCSPQLDQRLDTLAAAVRALDGEQT